MSCARSPYPGLVGRSATSMTDMLSRRSEPHPARTQMKYEDDPP